MGKTSTTVYTLSQRDAFVPAVRRGSRTPQTMSDTRTLVRLSVERLDPVVALEQVAGDVHWSRAHFEKELSSSVSRFFVLLRRGNILGYGGFWKVADEAQITNLVIAPQERRRGHGRYLLEQLLTHAQAEGCRVSRLEVRRQNQAAIALYRQMGFTVQGQRANAYTDPVDDAILMEKEL